MKNNMAVAREPFNVFDTEAELSQRLTSCSHTLIHKYGKATHTYAFL